MNNIIELFIYAPLASGVMLGILSVFLTFKINKHPSIPAFILLCITLSIWQFDLLGLYVADSVSEIHKWRRFPRTFTMLISPVSLYFVFVFLNKSRRNIVFISSIIFGAAYAIYRLIFFQIDTYTKTKVLWTPDTNIVLISWLLIVFIYAVYGLYLLFDRLKSTVNHREKQQIKFFFLGLTTLMVLNLDVIPLVLDINFFSLGSFAPVIMVLIFTYAITKHDLLNFEVVITKVASYSIVLAIISTVLKFGAQFFSSNSSLILFSIVVAFFSMRFGETLRQKIQTTAEKKWIKDHYDKTEAVKQLTKTLTPLFKREEIFKAAESSLKETIEIKSIQTITGKLDPQSQTLTTYTQNHPQATYPSTDPLIQYFKTPKPITPYKSLPKPLKQQLKQNQTDKQSVLIPLYSNASLEGIIILNQRLSEAKYVKKDIELFETIATQISVFLDRMRPYEEIQKDYEKNKEILYEARLQLERSERNKAVFNSINDCLHELRTPTNIIKQVITKLPDTDPIKKEKDRLEKYNNHIIDIIETTLGISSTQRKEKALLTINDTIQKAITLVPQDGFEIITTLMPDPPLILASHFDITQAILNLIHNAIDALEDKPEGQITLTTTTIGDRLQLQIQDNGKGIPQDLIDKIWQPYITTQATKGRGLGLTIVSGIIEDHGGIITVESQPGNTVFKINLPIADNKTSE